MITVAICTWNRASVLQRTLETMTRLQTNGLQWELLVVNNNCTDETDQVVSSVADRLPLRLLHEPQAGQSYARNRAIAESRGSHILWTDDDVLVEASWLTRLVEAFSVHRADWVFGRSEPVWPGAVPSWFSSRFSGAFALLDYGPDPFIVRETNRPFYGLNFGGTREAHRALGDFRTEFGFRGKEGGVGEDIDMFERALKAGMTIAYVPDAVVHHIIPEDRAEKPYHRRRQRVALPTYYRHLGEFYPTVTWMLGLPRFFFTKALTDLGRYAAAIVNRDTSGAFYYELQLLRFVGLIREAARAGFVAPIGVETRTSDSPDR